MKLASFDQGRIGVVEGDRIVDVTDVALEQPQTWPPVGMVQLIAQWPLRRAAIEAAAHERASLPLSDVRLEAPVQWPNKVIAFPANYHAHIDEMKHGTNGGVVSKFQASGQGFFLKANSSLSGPADAIVLPPLEGREIHHECELGIIVGKRGRAISREQSRDYVFGFTCLLDMVVRGKEERVMRKSFDTFCPTGPWITTADEVADFADISMRLFVNGEERQAATTRDLIVDIPEMIAMSSAVTTLEPGDIIATGTPAGVGPVRDGDVLEIVIDGVGSMRLPVVQGTLGRHPVWDASKAGLAV
ncbi:4-hydroxyphenylacetate degradation bifunctional isomerase/decarboxylase subunit HpaG2 [Burkholderia multivorans]|uniref:fumarylacetoacetate hydrolase family protein n=1 Tax=Burkholderia multivorans TaxID=87883 RepID=UPI00199435C7|nr:fumarylacetoacetate hydrolase family protein [Burkholderia multivorans]MBU9669191.1 fumarylacetoacetate hydrolase family protein [Burkholderia multivorans]CAB5300986.1 4-hydroxyphenylacetate degradation bifunctional isomerase/decarboxylase subunit HpaG2 [Burkholderia multivorans]CAB5305553.1 4-hydroxyphenylacetate degradation bifunctional isomerase/decarboxylase subunit HpaG2 [Burkholderia multivorans]CAB5310494.1 4-hydroxyphenylacetate degradation bifunctional isomerase/decarboxylase subuni